jgi:hypothetical protein
MCVIERKKMFSLPQNYLLILLHVGIKKRHFYGNAEDCCLGSNNCSVVILTGVSTVITKGSLCGNDHIYKRGLPSKHSLGMVAVEDSRDPTTTRDS